MQSKINDINVSTRILIFLITILSVLIANSIYFLIFMSILFIFLAILTEKSVNVYLDILKKSTFW